jgi:hypothetical protein
MNANDKKIILSKLTDDEIAKMYMSVYNRNYSKGIRINPKKEFKGHLNRQKRIDLIAEFALNADFIKWKKQLEYKLRINANDFKVEKPERKIEDWELDTRATVDEETEAELDNKELEGTGLKWENGIIKDDEDLPEWKRLKFASEKDYSDFMEQRFIDEEIKNQVEEKPTYVPQPEVPLPKTKPDIPFVSAKPEALERRKEELNGRVKMEPAISRAVTDSPPQRTITLKGIQANQEVTTRCNFKLEVDVLLVGERIVNLDAVIEKLQEEFVIIATTLVEQHSQRLY